MNCIRCGATLDAGTKFCTECGTISMRHDQPAAKPTVPPPAGYAPPSPGGYAPPPHIPPAQHNIPQPHIQPNQTYTPPPRTPSPSPYTPPPRTPSPSPYASPPHTPSPSGYTTPPRTPSPSGYTSPPRAPSLSPYPPSSHTPTPQGYNTPQQPSAEFPRTVMANPYGQAPGYMHPVPPPRRGASPVVKVLSGIGIVFIVLIVIGVISNLLPGDRDTVPATVPPAVVEVIPPVATAPPTATDVLPSQQIFANNRDAVMIIRGVCVDGHHWTGSGFFVTSTGIAVTNHHVMDGLVTSTAILYDGREFDIIGYFSYDIGNDLAVIQVDGRGISFDYVVLGNSDTTMVGENVFAIGGPDWDPLTFTPGMISRIAYEPISFNMYSIAGMFQSTAAIYGGNSGGPLLNDRGHVIGVNAAGHTVRASVQFAVPINRVMLPSTGDAVTPLPVGRTIPPGLATPGDGATYARYPFIPSFMSVSRHGRFYFSGTPADLGLSHGDVLYDFYEYLYFYELPRQHWISDTDLFDAELVRSGFQFQEIVDFGTDIWVYFFHPGHYISVSYGFLTDDELLIVAVVPGDVHYRFYGGGAAPIQDDVDFTGHPLLGTWAWDTDSSYIYVLNPNGTGMRGLAGMRYDIYWYAYGNILLIDTGGFAVEEWTFTINNNVLTIVSNQVDGLTWSYIRQP